MRAIALCLGLLGCGGSSPMSPDAAPQPDAPPDAAPFVLTGSVTDANTNPIDGASVCILDHAELPCATTGGDGMWTLAVPFLPGAIDIATSFTATGFAGAVFDFHEVPPSVAWAGSVALTTDAQAGTLLATQAGFTYPSTTSGFIRLRVFGLHGAAISGATASLSPSSGTGPVYDNTSGVPDPTLTATTTLGVLYFGNVAPGKVDITVHAAGVTCYDHPDPAVTSPIVGDWPPSSGGTLSARVLGGALTTSLYAYCY